MSNSAAAAQELSEHPRVKVLNLCEIYFSHNKVNQSDYLPNSQSGL